MSANPHSPPSSEATTAHEIDNPIPLRPQAHIDTPSEDLVKRLANNPKALEAAGGITDGEELGPEDDDDDDVANTPPAGEKEKQDPDFVLVNWDGPNDPANPKNWSTRKKWAATIIVSAFTFISPVSSSMVAPAADQIAAEFGITSTVLIAMTISVFVLAYAVGPLILGPLSELYGRSRVLQLANMFYLAWNLACGFAQNRGQLIAFRFLAGLGGSAPLSVGGGVLADLFTAEERGRAIAIYSLAPLLGPVIGPVAGAWIAERTTWRWVFWSTTIADGIIQLFGLYYLRETFAPVLLEWKAKRIQKEMADAGDHRETRTPFSGTNRAWKHLLAKSLVRPFALFAREPIIQLLGVYMAFVYGTLYLCLTTVPTIYGPTGGIYNQSVGVSGLHYIALGIGLFVSSQFGGRFLDKVYMYCKDRYGAGIGRPEFRLPLMVPGTIFLPVGLFIFGWGAQARVFWIVPDIGLTFIGAGLIFNFLAIQNYVIDAFTLHAASALAAVSCLRSLAGFGFPLFAPAMYNALGYGKGDTVLACAAIALGCPAPWFFWKYGERIRMASRYAAKKK